MNLLEVLDERYRYAEIMIRSMATPQNAHLVEKAIENLNEGKRIMKEIYIIWLKEEYNAGIANITMGDIEDRLK